MLAFPCTFVCRNLSGTGAIWSIRDVLSEWHTVFATGISISCRERAIHDCESWLDDVLTRHCAILLQAQVRHPSISCKTQPLFLIDFPLPDPCKNEFFMFYVLAICFENRGMCAQRDEWVLSNKCTARYIVRACKSGGPQIYVSLIVERTIHSFILINHTRNYVWWSPYSICPNSWSIKMLP